MVTRRYGGSHALEELDQGLVQRARLDGSQVETLVSGLEDPGVHRTARGCRVGSFPFWYQGKTVDTRCSVFNTKPVW